MDQLIRTIALGILQGLTEWLPISSTGHLKIFEKFLGLSVPILFDVFLHFGTLAVILVFFRNDVKGVLEAFLRLDFKKDYGRFVPLIIVGTVPTAIIGLVFIEFLEGTLQNFLATALAFVACGIVLCSGKTGKVKADSISFPKAFVIGVAQGFAVVPGLSRSGLTVTAALLLGIKPDKAFKFSFFLSIPAIIGALALTLCKESGELAASNLGLVEAAAGTVAAFAVGYLALKLLRRVIMEGKLHFFAFYCWALGILLALALSLGFL